MEALLSIHRILGFMLFLVAIAGVLVSLFAKAPGSGPRRGALVLGRVFAGLIDLQWLLGVIGFFALPAASRPSLWHPLLMTVMAVGFHVYLRRLHKEEPANQWPLVAGYVGAWLLIFIGMRVA